ncbi:MAG: MarR family winged helix-turn-helix transcriptional regulator [Pseudomonadota bacterium]|nr:MarR family winged helix-turn-helix transcriptional regulator [Gammaproteobacteria bacterium]
MNNEEAIEKFLVDEFNLSKKEIILYMNLVKHAPTTVLELSEIANLNRITTHVNIDNLSKKGLVTQFRKGRGSRRQITVEPPEKLSVILQARKAKLEAAEKQLDFITQAIASLNKENKQMNSTEIRHYTGKEEVKLIYDEVLKAKEIRTYANTGELLNIFPGNINKFVEAHNKNQDMYIWEIIADSDETQNYLKQMDPKRFFYKFAIAKLGLPPIDCLIFDGKIAMIEAKKGLVSGIIIENPSFYKYSEAIHEFVWDYL